MAKRRKRKTGAAPQAPPPKEPVASEEPVFDYGELKVATRTFLEGVALIYEGRREEGEGLILDNLDPRYALAAPVVAFDILFDWLASHSGSDRKTTGHLVARHLTEFIDEYLEEAHERVERSRNEGVTEPAGEGAVGDQGEHQGGGPEGATGSTSSA